jgi:hypothetical protein
MAGASSPVTASRKFVTRLLGMALIRMRDVLRINKR